MEPLRRVVFNILAEVLEANLSRGRGTVSEMEDDLLGGSYDHVCDRCEGRPVDPDERPNAAGERLCSVCAKERRDWLAAERERVSGWSDAELLGLIRWNDPNGAWSPRDLEEYGTTHEDLVDTVVEWMDESGETPEEWRRGARR